MDEREQHGRHGGWAPAFFEDRARVRCRARPRGNARWVAGRLSSDIIDSGLTPKEAQEAMGHADIRTTLNIYAKAVPGWQEQAAAKLDAYLDGGTVVGQSRSETERSRAVPQRFRVAQ